MSNTEAIPASSSLQYKNLNHSNMTAKASDEFNRNDTDEGTPSCSPVLPCSSINQSPSNIKMPQAKPTDSASATRNIRRLADFCMIWCHTLPFISRTSRPSTSLMRLTEKSDNKIDHDTERDDSDIHEPTQTSISASHLSETSWDYISTFVDEIEHPGQISGCSHRLYSDCKHRYGNATSYHDHSLTSEESLSLQTIYDGEIFGRDYGSSGAREPAESEVPTQ